MNKKLIILTGHLATGKTTFSIKLSEKLKIPCFNKDYIKEEIGKSIDVKDSKDSNLIGSISYDILFYVVDRLMMANVPLIIESCFSSQSIVNIKRLLKKYNYQVLTFFLTGDLKISHKRFLVRDKTRERNDVHKFSNVTNNFSEFLLTQEDKKESNFEFSNKIISIDTTNFEKVNFNKYIQDAKDFLENN